jgi:adenosylcobinamide kinase/adenosylcobinamide-phosphate guanylyltransferase
MPLILIGGGSRSGKSRYALELARARGSRRGFLATAQACDDEMRERIRMHREDRGADFVTVEEPQDLVGVISRSEALFDVLVVDCLTLWLNNLLLAGIEPDFAELFDRVATSPVLSILVTNEVGCGIVPENALARRFRDLAGTMNQRAAASAIEAYWMALGIPLRLK